MLQFLPNSTPLNEMSLRLVDATKPSPNTIVELFPWHIKELLPIMHEPLKIITPPPLSYMNAIVRIHVPTKTS